MKLCKLRLGKKACWLTGCSKGNLLWFVNAVPYDERIVTEISKRRDFRNIYIFLLQITYFTSKSRSRHHLYNFDSICNIFKITDNYLNKCGDQYSLSIQSFKSVLYSIQSWTGVAAPLIFLGHVLYAIMSNLNFLFSIHTGGGQK